MKELVERINTLARKDKQEGLSQEEKNEQAQLRKAYIEKFRGRMKDTLLGVKVVDQKGQDITPKKLKEEQARKNK